MTNKPNFAAWSLENLARFAAEAFDELIAKQAQIDDLKIDKATLLATIRQHWVGETK
jgi:hypothetical protein